jgi:hypothetical protein
MTRDQLEHAIRAACDVARDDELIVFGSQAILGEYPDAPPGLRPPCCLLGGKTAQFLSLRSWELGGTPDTASSLTTSRQASSLRIETRTGTSSGSY